MNNLNNKETVSMNMNYNDDLPKIKITKQYKRKVSDMPKIPNYTELYENGKKRNRKVITCIEVKKNSTKESPDNKTLISDYVSEDVIKEIIKSPKKELDDDIISVPKKRKGKYRTKEQLAQFGVEYLGSNDKHATSDSRSLNQVFRKSVGNQFQCLLCYKLLKETSLKQHATTHIGFKPFRCRYCKLHYSRKADAMRHVISKHRVSDLSFKCNLCAKTCSTSALLLIHLEKHKRTPTIYRCHICGIKFKNKSYYKDHMSFIHSINVNNLASSMASKAQKQINKITYCEQSEDDSVMVTEDEIELGIQEDLDNFFPEVENRTETNIIVIKEEPDDDEQLSDTTLREDCEVIPLDNEVVVHKGNIIVTQKIIKAEIKEEEEELVTKAIEATASQSESTLASIQSTIGTNFSSIPFKQYFKAFTTDNEKEEELSSSQMSEIHITATIDNEPRKFIMKIPSSFVCDPSTTNGRESLMKMVNHLCSGKGRIDGLIGVTVHDSVDQE